jgi:acetyl-CoA/propionyl-CoA carboxylase biotin carboxyl carrier protein
MPGKVIKVLVTEGQAVKQGDPIAIIEAMKMEHVVTAPCSGAVSIFCTEGTTVGDGFKLAQVSP